MNIGQTTDRITYRTANDATLMARVTPGNLLLRWTAARQETQMIQLCKSLLTQITSSVNWSALTLSIIELGLVLCRLLVHVSSLSHSCPIVALYDNGAKSAP